VGGFSCCYIDKKEKKPEGVVFDVNTTEGKDVTRLGERIESGIWLMHWLMHLHWLMHSLGLFKSEVYHKN
jgi:hypothetical protein